MNKKIILFDIDYTLFDTTKFKEIITKILQSQLPNVTFEDLDEIYYQVRLGGAFDPDLFAKIFKEKFDTSLTEKEIKDIWFDEGKIKQALYPEVASTLQELQKREDIILGIFSSGKADFQRQKISSLHRFFTDEYIYIADFKNTLLPEVMNTYKNNELIVVDDFITFLQKAKSFKKDTVTIWMKRGKFAEKAEIPEGFYPDKIITNLAQVVPII